MQNHHRLDEGEAKRLKEVSFFRLLAVFSYNTFEAPMIFGDKKSQVGKSKQFLFIHAILWNEPLFFWIYPPFPVM